MLGPENAGMGKHNAKSLGASPVGLFMYVENVDKAVAKATGLGATAQGQVMDMFWGIAAAQLSIPTDTRG
jgi:PhnB protein